MTVTAGDHHNGLWGQLAAQPRSPGILGRAFLAGLLGALITGLAVGFDATDDPVVAQVRTIGALLTGIAAGAVGRGPWGWVMASCGAALGIAPFMRSDQELASFVLGAIFLSLPVLAPGYALVRVLAYARSLQSLRPRGRAAALRVPLRRLLRAGVVLSGMVCLVAAEAAAAFALGQNAGLFAVLAMGAAVTGSYAMYRLIDRLDHGERWAAATFTVVYGLIGLGATGLMVADRAPGGAMGYSVIAVTEVLVPSLFMALAPWALIRIVDMQRLSTASPFADVDAPPATAERLPTAPPVPSATLLWNPAAAPASRHGPTPPPDTARRLPAAAIPAGLAAAGCLLLALIWLLASQGAGTGPGAGPAARSHDAPELEALLPASVGGRPLATWSVRGDAALRLWGMTTDEVRATHEALTTKGVDVGDVVQATAGRSDVEADPPYFVLAHRIPTAARDLLGGHAIASAGFTRDTLDTEMEDQAIGGKTVWVGPMDLLVQNEHQRGRPYVYGSAALDTSFIVITDDAAWAEEAIDKLPD